MKRSICILSSLLLLAANCDELIDDFLNEDITAEEVVENGYLDDEDLLDKFEKNLSRPELKYIKDQRGPLKYLHVGMDMNMNHQIMKFSTNKSF